MKFYGTDSTTAKAASKEGAFLIQTEIVSRFPPHEAKSIFSVIPNHGLCLSAISRPEEPCLVSLGPSQVQVWRGNGDICCGLWRDIRTGLRLPCAGELSPCFGCCGNIPAASHSSGLQLLPAQPLTPSSSGGLGCCMAASWQKSCSV